MSISRRSVLCLLFIVGFGNQLRAQSLNISKLDSLCTAIETNDRAMFSLAIAKSGHIIYQRAIGSSTIDGAQRKRATPETEYRIGSVSKMFTSVMILQLVEEKKLKLSTPLAKFFPSIPNAKKITIEQMLGHRSGLYDFTRDSTFGRWMTEPRTHDQMVKVIAAGKPMFAPGAEYEYSNSNYVLLGYIVERVSKHPYAEELAKRITKRIGLQHTYLGGKIGSRPNEAGSYSKVDTAWEAGPESDMSIPGGAGAIVSTSGDLIQFIDALFKNMLLQPASLKRMTTFKDAYGLGIIKSPSYHGYTLGHNGRIDDFVSDVAYSPNDSMEMVILSNGSQLRLNSIVVAVMKISNNMSYTIPSFQLYRVSTEKLPGYEGLYSAKGDPMKIEVKLEAHKLYARATGQGAFPLEPTSADTFGFEDAGITMQFHRATDGTVLGFDILQHGHKETYERE